MVPAPVRQVVRLEPPVPVNVRLEVDGRRVTYWVEDAQQRVLKDRSVSVELTSGRKEAVEVRDGRTSFTVSGAARVSVSVTDVKTRVVAVTEVKP